MGLFDFFKGGADDNKPDSKEAKPDPVEEIKEQLQKEIKELDLADGKKDGKLNTNVVTGQIDDQIDTYKGFQNEVKITRENGKDFDAETRKDLDKSDTSYTGKISELEKSKDDWEALGEKYGKDGIINLKELSQKLQNGGTKLEEIPGAGADGKANLTTTLQEANQSKVQSGNETRSQGEDMSR